MAYINTSQLSYIFYITLYRLVQYLPYYIYKGGISNMLRDCIKYIIRYS